MGLFDSIFGSYSKRELKRVEPIAQKVFALEDEYRKLSDEELQNKTKEFKQLISEGASLNNILPDAFATMREASDRVLGMRHFDCQIIGGIILHLSLIHI